MEAPRSRDVKSDVEPRLRRVWNAFNGYVDAAWEHLRYNWTDALLALGFVAVIVLSFISLLKK